MKQKEKLLAQIDTYLENNLIQVLADDIQTIREELNDLLTNEENYELTSEIKSKIQKEASEALDCVGGSGLIIGATGIGKSKIAIDRIDEMYGWDRERPSILLVVPTEKLRDEGWKNECYKWNFLNWQDISPICYASLHTITDTKWDLIILDECHNITEANAEFFFSQGNSWKNIIALTATEPRNIVKLDLLKRIGLKVVYEIGIDVSVKLGLVSPYDVVAIGVELDRVTKNIKAGSKAKPFYSTEYSNYEYLTRRYVEAPTKFNALMRMRFIYNLPSKVEATRSIVKHLLPDNLRTLIFCGSIAQAESLSPNTYHSKSSNVNFDRFNEEDINSLYCVDGLNEGHNINNLDCGIMLKVNSSDLRFIQRVGRHIRYRPGHKGKIIIIYTKSTVDEKWMKTAIKGVSREKVTWIEYNKLRKGEQTINF